MSGCTSLNKTCLFGGCYGPFELMLKTEKGEHVEDVIIDLAFLKGSSHGGGGRTYQEYAIVNTDEVIRLPRSYVYRSDSKQMMFYFSIYHPDYQAVDLYASFSTDDLGVVNLGTKIIMHSQDLHDRSNAKQVIQWRKEGLREAEINKKLEGKRVQMPGINPSYFAYLTTLGRNDLVEKYLPTRLKKVADYKCYTATEIADLEKRVRKNIKKKAERL